MHQWIIYYYLSSHRCEDSRIWLSHQSIRTSYSSRIRRRRINILHNARLISDRVRQRASSDAHYDSWGQMVHVFLLCRFVNLDFWQITFIFLLDNHIHHQFLIIFYLIHFIHLGLNRFYVIFLLHLNFFDWFNQKIWIAKCFVQI